MIKYKQRYTYHFFIAATVLFAAYTLIYAAKWQIRGEGLFAHCDYDSYTRQAAAWWQGSAALPDNVTWLELAVYNGSYYVSFPPFPSVIQFFLIPIFGTLTPDNFINTLFGLGAFTLIYRFLMRRGFSGLSSAAFALLMTAGSNLLYLSASGWVWFSAQTQAFFFSVLAVSLIYSERKAAWYFSFFSLGLAVACRPFNIVYAPLILYLLYGNIKEDRGFFRTLVSCIKYVLPMVFVGTCLAAYNYIRFGNPLEFGHNYLPEFENAPQFSINYIPGNFLEILKLPGIDGGKLFWPKFNGTLFFLVNPAFIILAVSLVRKLTAKHAVYLACFAAQLLLLLCHKTMGGWQFGCRYLVDMIPFMLVIFEGDRKYKTYDASAHAILPLALAAFGIVINIWGAIWFYTQMAA